MANYSEILRLFPSARHYVRQRRWARRGEVLAYAPNLETDVFSTDPYGFRHGEVNGERYGLAAALSGVAYGLVLGSSDMFGFGLDCNAQTIASRLSEHCGVYCLNISFPEADLRTLCTAATRIASETPLTPAYIVCFGGGTLSRYCYTRRCDPLFGSPDFLGGNTESLSPGTPEEATAFANLTSYARFWFGQLSDLARRCGCPLVVHDQASAFDKTSLSEVEATCALTLPGNEDEERFAAHRLRNAQFRANFLAAASNAARIASSEADALSFIDEFHYTAAASERIASDIAQSLYVPDRTMVEA
ncbi:MAG TPA: hypothetical protein VGN80_03960 [Devosiaceae bacterium]|jgi:hypothetical protein|nr:hypothetical protein [Devosiaceae bacterium]